MVLESSRYSRNPAASRASCPDAERSYEVWRPIAVEQLRRRENQQPLTHRLVRLPAVSRHSRRLLGPLESFFVDG